MELKGKTVAVLVEQQYQEMEVWYPYYRLEGSRSNRAHGGTRGGKTYPSKLGYPAKSDKGGEGRVGGDIGWYRDPRRLRPGLLPPRSGRPFSW